MISREIVKDLYKVYPVLSDVNQELISNALSNAKVLTLKAGKPIFEELQPCNVFPFILSGDIRVYKQSVHGRELSLYNVTPGDVCVVTAGCLLGDQPYNASGIVKEDCTLLMVASNDFENLLTLKAFREFIFSLISRRILGLMQLVEEVAFQRLDRRLAALLLRQGRHIKVSHQELADELGTVREMVTRLLHSFADTNLITLGRGQIEILDESALKYIVEN